MYLFVCLQIATILVLLVLRLSDFRVWCRHVKIGRGTQYAEHIFLIRINLKHILLC